MLYRIKINVQFESRLAWTWTIPSQIKTESTLFGQVKFGAWISRIFLLTITALFQVWKSRSLLREAEKSQVLCGYEKVNESTWNSDAAKETGRKKFFPVCYLCPTPSGTLFKVVSFQNLANWDLLTFVFYLFCDKFEMCRWLGAASLCKRVMW